MKKDAVIKVAMSLLAFAVFAKCHVMCAETYIIDGDNGGKIRTSGSPLNEINPSLGSGNAFYGYRKTGEGPGDDSFDRCLKAAKERGLLLMIIYGKDSCPTCSKFAANINAAARAMSISGTVNAYFRGTSPACLSAYNFFNEGEGLKSAGGAKGSCHIIGFYGVPTNGIPYKYSAILPASFEDFSALRSSQRLAWSAWKNNPKNKITAAARFANGNTAGAQLQATDKTDIVHVPLARNSLTDLPEEDAFVATYPDGVSITNTVQWLAGETGKVHDVVVATKWISGKTVKMELFDSAGNRLDQSEIHCVDGGNAFAFPDMEFDENGFWGRWTLYSDENWNAATQKVYTANISSNPENDGVQSFVLKVTGGAVWNPATVAFATDVFDSDEFAEFCESNKVVTLLQECSDPETGASLFSHKVAKNGRSGSAFLSRNGLDASQCTEPPASNIFEVALYRPDGTLAGILAPQMNGGVCDRDENLTRLRELLFLADDLTEPGNNAEATTTLKAVYGITTNDVGVAEQYQTLNISDKKDVFELVRVPAGAVVSVTANSLPETRYGGQEKPALRVWKYTSNAKTVTSDVASFSVDESGAQVWKFSDDDVKYGLYADVTAWTNDYAATGLHGVSTFVYPLLVNAAPEYPGVISFAVTNTEVDVDDNATVELNIERTGYTGEATAKVELTRCELPATSYSWANSGNTTNLVWRDGEPGVKSVFVNVRNVTWEDSVSNLVFTITSVTGASLDEEKKECKIAIQQEDDKNAKTGLIRITDPEPSADGSSIWKKSGVVKVTVSRERVKNEATGKNEARGEAHATISVTGGAVLSTNRLDWLSGERTGEREITVTMPDVGAAGQRHVVLNVTGTDCDGKKISETTTSQLKFTVVPSDAPEFMSGIDAEAYKYVAFDKSAMLSGYDPDAMEIVEPALLSGSLPPGLTVKADGENWELRIKGVPTGTGLYTADYQLVLRRKSNGNLVKTKPVTVKIVVKALGGDAGEEADAVIPAFAEKRTWQYLPMTSEAGTLEGLLNLSASPRGSLSARYTTVGKTVAFTASELGSVAKDESSVGYRASSRMQKADCTLDAEFTTDGRVFARLQPQEGAGLGFASDLGSKPWLSIKGGASAWKGRYVVAIPAGEAGQGPAVIALNASSVAMAKSGKVTYNGVLPDGRPFNGVTAFVPAKEGASCVKLPIFWSSAGNTISAMLVVTNAGARASVVSDSSIMPFWCANSGDRHELPREMKGGTFVAENWGDAWKRNFGPATTMLRFKYGGKEGNATVAANGTSIAVAESGSVEEDGFQLESIVLNRVSGMVTGSLKVMTAGRIATIGFHGVVLPYDTSRFMMGSAWHTEEWQGESVRKVETVELVPAN